MVNHLSVDPAWKIFPLHHPIGESCSCRLGPICGQIGKHPMTPHGLSDASNDAEQIERWWRQNPRANVGIVTGACSGFFVLDIDPRHNGDETLRHLEELHGPLPQTVETITGSGGRHILFKHPGVKVRNDSRGQLLGQGIDVRGDGGYIVGPGSKHASGRTYEWELSSHPDDVPIADAPQWLLDSVTERPKAVHEEKPVINFDADPDTDRRNLSAAAKCYLAKCPPAIQGQGGDQKTFSIAGHLLAFRANGQRLSTEDVTGIMFDSKWNEQCTPPWTYQDLRAKVASAAKNGQPRAPKEARDNSPIEFPNAPSDDDATGGHPERLPQFATVGAMTNVKWLWKHYIPLGCLTMISGEQGEGKSTMLYDFIARFTSGQPMPDGQTVPICKVLILSCEDSPDDSAGPKIFTAGGDLTKIVKWPKDFDIDQLPKLEAALRADHEIKMVVIEPIYEKVQGKTDNVKDVGLSLGKIQQVAQRCGVSIIGVHHFNKGKGTTANEKTMGSIGFTSKARATWGVVPKKGERNVKRFAAGKRNVKLSSEALQFVIEDAECENPETGERIETAKVRWLDERVTADLDTLIAENAGTVTKDAATWLREFLTCPKPSKDIEAAAMKFGFSRDVLFDAKNKLGVKSKKDGIAGPWIWQLPSEHTSHSDDPFDGRPF